MNELLLMNPETVHKHSGGKQGIQIVFPKGIKNLRANPEYAQKKNYADKQIPVLGITAKQAVAGVSGVGATVAVSKLLKLEGWSDVAASGAVTIAGTLLAGSMDKEAGKAFAITGTAVTGLKAVAQLIKVAKGQKTKSKTTRKGKRSLADDDIDKLLGNVEDLSNEELDAILGASDVGNVGAEDLDLFGALDAGIEDLGQIVVES